MKKKKKDNDNFMEVVTVGALDNTGEQETEKKVLQLFCSLFDTDTYGNYKDYNNLSVEDKIFLNNDLNSYFGDSLSSVEDFVIQARKLLLIKSDNVSVWEASKNLYNHIKKKIPFDVLLGNNQYSLLYLSENNVLMSLKDIRVFNRKKSIQENYNNAPVLSVYRKSEGDNQTFKTFFYYVWDDENLQEIPIHCTNFKYWGSDEWIFKNRYTYVDYIPFNEKLGDIMEAYTDLEHIPYNSFRLPVYADVSSIKYVDVSSIPNTEKERIINAFRTFITDYVCDCEYYKNLVNSNEDEKRKIYAQILLENQEPNKNLSFDDYVMLKECEGIANNFLCWIAYLIQKPRKTKFIAPILYGGQGYGKGLLLSILKKLVGETNTTNPNNDVLNNRFQSEFSNCLLTIFDESKIRNADELEAVKRVVANDTVRCELKGKEATNKKNYTSFIFCCNSSNLITSPMYADTYQRRLLYISSHKEEDRTGKDLIMNTIKEIKNDNTNKSIAILRDYFLNYPLDNYNPYYLCDEARARGERLANARMYVTIKALISMIDGDTENPKISPNIDIFGNAETENKKYLLKELKELEFFKVWSDRCTKYKSAKPKTSDDYLEDITEENFLTSLGFQLLIPTKICYRDKEHKSVQERKLKHKAEVIPPTKEELRQKAYAYR